MNKPNRSGRLPLVVVLGAKGGVGTTTVAWQLAQALADAGRKPLAVDAHLWQPDLARVAGVRLDNGPTVLDVVADRAKPAAAVRLDKGPALLPGDWSQGAAGAEAAGFGQRLHKTLVLRRREPKGLGDRFDAVVVDGGPGRSPWAESLLAVADLVLLVATPDRLALLSAYALLKLGSGREAGPPTRLVMNRCASETHGRTAHAGVRDTCRRHLKTSLPLAGWLPDDARLSLAGAALAPLSRPLCRRVCEAIDSAAAADPEPRRAA